MALFHVPDAPSSPDLDAFAAGLSGRLIRPGDDDYDTAREVHNAAYDRRPLAIVQAAGTADVALTVDLARDHGLDLAIRSGGHSVAGYGTVDDGVLLDLSGLRGLHIDPERRLAWAQPGLTAGEFTAAAHAHGLATPFGDAASVGLGGITLGGGIRWPGRKHRPASGSPVGAQDVTPRGEVLIAGEDSNGGLLWAVLRCGGKIGGLIP